MQSELVDGWLPHISSLKNIFLHTVEKGQRETSPLKSYIVSKRKNILKQFAYMIIQMKKDDSSYSSWHNFVAFCGWDNVHKAETPPSD